MCAVLGVIVLLEVFHVTNFVGPNPADSQLSESDVKTTSDEPSAQADYNGGEPRDAGNTIHENEGSAIIDGSSGAYTGDTSRPIVSRTGEITVYSPQNNTLVSPSIEVAGKSSLASVNYRVIDSATGVVATGVLPVVDGHFAGKLTVSTSAKEGRLDLFASKADGTEYSSIEIPVRFQ